MEYRYPFLDVKLVELYYSMKSSLKYSKGYGRYAFRKSLEGVVPKRILWRRDKSGNTVPNIEYRFTKSIEGFEQLIRKVKKTTSIIMLITRK